MQNCQVKTEKPLHININAGVRAFCIKAYCMKDNFEQALGAKDHSDGCGTRLQPCGTPRMGKKMRLTPSGRQIPLLHQVFCRPMGLFQHFDTISEGLR